MEFHCLSRLLSISLNNIWCERVCHSWARGGVSAHNRFSRLETDARNDLYVCCRDDRVVYTRRCEWLISILSAAERREKPDPFPKVHVYDVPRGVNGKKKKTEKNKNPLFPRFIIHLFFSLFLRPRTIALTCCARAYTPFLCRRFSSSRAVYITAHTLLLLLLLPYGCARNKSVCVCFFFLFIRFFFFS